ncbi:MAG: hypothetical protein M1815_001865 [Lichina confinis]|nr:MAG: hypothetical protein M1815_001865 [Lichina confinis]
MADVGIEGKDHWSGEVGTHSGCLLAHRANSNQAYAASAEFVPRLASAVVGYLDPQPVDRILDLGCGDGVLTAEIARRSGSVVGLDSSPSMIGAAQSRFGGVRNCQFKVVDCRHIEDEYGDGMQGHFDKVFSNAALHWILRSPSTRSAVFGAARSALKAGGLFVFEMGGHGNVAEAHTALRAAVMHQGLSIEQVNESCPWFFASEGWTRKALQDASFEVLRLETEWRPTRLTSHDGGGLEGWIRLMGASFLDAIERVDAREAAVREVCRVLQPVCTRRAEQTEADLWLNYVRSRAVARAI